MEILFSSQFLRTEVILLLVLWGAILGILSTFLYSYIVRIIQIFGPKKRDAVLQARDQDILKKRQEIEQESEEDEEEKEELPPPLTLEEIEQIEAPEAMKDAECVTISGDDETKEEITDEATESPAASENTAQEAAASEDHIQAETPVTRDAAHDASECSPLDEVHTATEEDSAPETVDAHANTDTPVESTHHTASDANIEKTFEDIEREADGEFQSNESPDEGTAEEKKETETPSVTDEPNNTPSEASISEPIQESVESIGRSVQNIMDQAPVSKSQHTERLFELTNQAKTFMARGMTVDARSVIIEGLSLKKDHRDLNLILAEIYEQEQDYEKAEIIYKDIALVYHEDSEVLRRLANLLIITKKFPIAYEMYKKILSLGGDEENSLYILAHLAQELGDMSDVYQYSRQYLKQWPTSKEILTLLSESEIALGKRKDAIATLIKLKNLSPYNAFEIAQMIEKLSAEEELAGNFGQGE